MVERGPISPRLGSAAAVTTDQTAFVDGVDDGEEGLSGLTKFLLGAALVIPICVVLYLVASQRTSQTETATPEEDGSQATTTELVQPSTPASQGEATETGDGNEEGEAVTSTSSEPAVDETLAVAAPVQTVPPVRGVLAGEQVILEGDVASEQVAASLVELLTPLVGEGNVENQLVVTPDAGPVTGMSLTVADEVLFTAGSDEISSQFFPTLDQIVTLLQLNPNISVVVKGHTDSEGDEVQNLALSQRRADAVVQYIAENSINRFRLEPRGRGSGEPIADNDTQEGRQRNRRIEFEVVGFSLDFDG